MPRIAGLAGVLLALFAAPVVATAAGVLIPVGGGEPIAIESHRVEATVTDGIARTKVRQTFVNRQAATLEAIYHFPLPGNAALVDVAMEVGGRRLEGLLAERRQARKVYDDIVGRKKDPALVEQVGRGRYRLSVFPVFPGKPTVVEITYVEHLPLSRGEFRYVYPLTLGGKVASRVKDLTMVVSLRASAPLTDVRTDAADAEIRPKGTGETLVSLERRDTKLERDVVVTGKVAVTKPTLAIRTWRPRDGDGYFLAILTPPPPAEDQLIPRDVVLVLDTSGSMDAEKKLDQVKRAARHLLANLRPADRVNIVLFGSTVVPFSDAPVAATPENVAAAKEFILGLTPMGGTALGDALEVALAMQACPDRVQTVVLITDGRPTVGLVRPADLVAVAAQGGKKGIAVYPFGVGSEADAALLRGIARASGGQAEIIRAGGEVATRLTRFLDRTSAPVVADVTLAAEGIKLYDLFPRPRPVTHVGEQVVVTGRYRGAGPSRVTLGARIGDRPLTVSTSHRFLVAEGGDRAVSDLFARHCLEFLQNELQVRSGLHDAAYFAAVDRGAYRTSDEIVTAIVAVSLAHGVQSAFTSFLVLLPEDRNRVDPLDLEAIRKALESSRRVRGVPAPPIGPATVPGAPVPGSRATFGKGFGNDSAGDLPFEGPFTGAAIGIGGGAGGAFGARGGSMRHARFHGGGERTESAVKLALSWLATQQDEDGSWEGAGENTGLVLLAYLGNGNTHKVGWYKRTIKRALRYLKRKQAPDGCFADRAKPGWLREHAIATMAMAEAYGMTGSPLFKGPAQRGIDLLHRTQVPYLGWGTGNRTKPCDAATTYWAISALKVTRAAGGLRTSQAAFDGVVAWTARTTDPATGRVVMPKGASLSTEAATAGAILARIFCGEDPAKSEWIDRQARLTLASPLRWTSTRTPDPWHVYFGTLSLFQLGGDGWEKWNAAMKPALLETQVTEPAEQRGSWEAASPALGRVGTTALACLSVEVYYRYPRVFRVRK